MGGPFFACGEKRKAAPTVKELCHFPQKSFVISMNIYNSNIEILCKSCYN